MFASLGGMHTEHVTLACPALADFWRRVWESTAQHIVAVAGKAHAFQHGAGSAHLRLQQVQDGHAVAGLRERLLGKAVLGMPPAFAPPLAVSPKLHLAIGNEYISVKPCITGSISSAKGQMLF